MLASLSILVWVSLGVSETFSLKMPVPSDDRRTRADDPARPEAARRPGARAWECRGVPRRIKQTARRRRWIHPSAAGRRSPCRMAGWGACWTPSDGRRTAAANFLPAAIVAVMLARQPAVRGSRRLVGRSARRQARLLAARLAFLAGCRGRCEFGLRPVALCRPWGRRQVAGLT
jgi:hypothetical protein